MNEQKNALVTGGSRGIGLAIARQLLDLGYRVAINGVRERTVAEDLLNELSQSGEVYYFQSNIGREEDRGQLVKQVRKELGPLNILINNAGVAPPVRADVLEVTIEDYDQVMDVNLKGTFFLTQALAKDMLDHRKDDPGFKACIVNISSISADVASINRAAYCLSKAGISMLTKLLAVRMAEANIPVYEIRPGIISTDMTAPVAEKYDRLIAGGLTLEQRQGTPEDIAKIVAALVSGSIPYSTGQVLTPDGGMGVKRL